MDQDLLKATKGYRESPSLGNALKLCNNLVRSGIADQPSSSGQILSYDGTNLLIVLGQREIGFSPFDGLPIYSVTSPETDGSQVQYILNYRYSARRENQHLVTILQQAVDYYNTVTFSTNEAPETIQRIELSYNRDELSRFYAHCLEEFQDRLINLSNLWIKSKNDPIISGMVADTYLQFIDRNEMISKSKVEDQWWRKAKPLIGASGPAIRAYDHQPGVWDAVPYGLTKMFVTSGFRQHIMIKSQTFDFHFFDPNRPWDDFYSLPGIRKDNDGFFLSAVVNPKTGQMFCNENCINPLVFDGLFKNAIDVLLVHYQSFNRNFNREASYIPVSDALLWALFS